MDGLRGEKWREGCVSWRLPSISLPWVRKEMTLREKRRRMEMENIDRFQNFFRSFRSFLFPVSHFHSPFQLMSVPYFISFYGFFFPSKQKIMRSEWNINNKSSLTLTVCIYVWKWSGRQEGTDWMTTERIETRKGVKNVSKKDIFWGKKVRRGSEMFIE